MRRRQSQGQAHTCTCFLVKSGDKELRLLKLSVIPFQIVSSQSASVIIDKDVRGTTIIKLGVTFYVVYNISEYSTKNKYNFSVIKTAEHNIKKLMLTVEDCLPLL